MERRCVSCQAPIDSEVCPYCGYPVHSQSEPHQLPVGTMLRNRYQLGKVLGQGGFGITYVGWDTLMETVVAVKEFYPTGVVNRRSEVSTHVECLTEKMDRHYQMSKERFLREAKALVKFRSIPEVVDLLDFVEENNTAYIVMEYVRGVDLAKYIQHKGGRLTVDETFRILKPVMEALAAVHKGDIVHRDISPDNIILDPMGGAKLLDFGAVRTVEDPDLEKGLAKSTEAILKHGFAPIEQYNTRGSLGPWTDEYAMCATIWYCLTGTIPEEASIRVSEGIDPDWRSIPGLTQQQCAALEKGISVRAKDRFPSMDALLEALFGNPVPMYQAYQPQQPAFAKTEAIQPSGYNVQPQRPPVQPPVQPQRPPVQPPVKPVKEKKRGKWPIFAAIAGVLVVAILAGLLVPGLLNSGSGKQNLREEPSGDTPATMAPTVAITEPVETLPENDLAGTYVIKMWAPNGADTVILQRIADFERAYPGVEIELSIEFVEANDAATVVLDRGTTPDLYFASSDTAQALFLSGKAAPLGEEAAKFVRENNDAASVAAVGLEGTLYGYPASSDNGYFLYYDKRVISPTEAESLEAIINACEESGYDFRYELTNSWYVPSLFFATGCRSEWTMNAQGQFTSIYDTFCSPEGVIAAKAMQKLAQSPCWAENLDYRFDNMGAVVSGIWDLPNAQKAYGDDLGVTILPSFQVDGKSYQMHSFSGHKVLVVSPQADEKREEVLSLLAQFLTDETSQLSYFNALTWVPSNLNAQNSDAVQANPAAAALAAQMQYAVPQGAIHGAWWDVCRNMSMEIIAARTEEEIWMVLEEYAAAIDSAF